MTVRFPPTDGMHQVPLYHHVSVGDGTRQVFLAGQVAWDAAGAVVGDGDVAAQTEQVFRNIAAGLAAAGATFANVVRYQVYAIDLDASVIAAIAEGIDRAAAELGPIPHAPLTGIGVAALAGPGLLIEIEATAVL